MHSRSVLRQLEQVGVVLSHFTFRFVHVWQAYAIFARLGPPFSLGLVEGGPGALAIRLPLPREAITSGSR